MEALRAKSSGFDSQWEHAFSHWEQASIGFQWEHGNMGTKLRLGTLRDLGTQFSLLQCNSVVGGMVHTPIHTGQVPPTLYWNSVPFLAFTRTGRPRHSGEPAGRARARPAGEFFATCAGTPIEIRLKSVHRPNFSASHPTHRDSSLAEVLDGTD